MHEIAYILLKHLVKYSDKNASKLENLCIEKYSIEDTNGKAV